MVSFRHDGLAMSRPNKAQRRTTSSPRSLVALGVLAAVLVTAPVVALLSRTPWSSLLSLLGSELVRDALVLSLFTSLASAALATVFGVPLAWMLSRVDFPGKSVVRALVTLPMVLPPVVGGAALLFAFGRRGLVGGPVYDTTGFVLPFSIWGVIAANTFVAMPFLVLTVEGALSNVDRRYEGAAASLGATPLRVFRQVTLPMIRPSLLAGVVLAWARALGEFGATVTFAGNLQGRTQTLPLAVFVALESDRDAAIAISLLLMVISLTVLVALRDRWWSS